MLPRQLTERDFAGYPPQSHALAVTHLLLLRELPLAFLPIFLREWIRYDWLLPAERIQVDGQVRTLSSLSPADLVAAMRAFASLRLDPRLERMNWIDRPAVFIQEMTAWLWSSGQIEAFNAAAASLNRLFLEAQPPAKPSVPRFGIVILGQGVERTEYPLFRKLRASGVLFTRIQPQDGVRVLLEYAASRAVADDPVKTRAHWYIDGGEAIASSPALTTVSYQALSAQRAKLLRLTDSIIASGTSGAEALRTHLTQLIPEDIGFPDDRTNKPLYDFLLNVLAEGSGTQIFSTTFVQWTARECLRRAQPKTLLLRYAPRQQLLDMNAMLRGATPTGYDAEGSLIDADMGAYYTWLDMQRLSGADETRFLVWFQGNNQALAIGPGLPKATTSDSSMGLSALLRLLT